jgi:hypothetical protein
LAVNFFVERFKDHYLLYHENGEPVVTVKGNVLRSSNSRSLELLISELTSIGQGDYFELLSIYSDISAEKKTENFKISNLLSGDYLFRFLKKHDYQTVCRLLPVFSGVFSGQELELNGDINRSHLKFIRELIRPLGWPELIFCAFVRKKKRVFLLPLLYVSGTMDLSVFVTEALIVSDLPEAHKEKWLCDLEKPFRFLGTFMETEG